MGSPSECQDHNYHKRRRKSSTSSVEEGPSTKRTRGREERPSRPRQRQPTRRKRRPRSASSSEGSGGRHKDFEARFDQLSYQVNAITDFIQRSMHPETQSQNRSESSSDDEAPLESVTFKDFNTTLKDKGFGKTEEAKFELLKNLQRFDSREWADISFFDIQKSFLAVPGFKELETNDELRHYDKSKYLASFEKTLASLTHAFLLHRDHTQTCLQNILKWAGQCENITAVSLKDKITDLFIEDDKYNKSTNDILQILCGKRADVVLNRRSEILKNVTDTVTAAGFRKIPPSYENLFQADKLKEFLKNEGGLNKVFPAQNKPRKNQKFPRFSAANRGYFQPSVPPFRFNFRSKPTFPSFPAYDFNQSRAPRVDRQEPRRGQLRRSGYHDRNKRFREF
ncbi:uncharacterized protein LOC134654276 [Cydia amplana]|uniref:uncharacterized protein LOC134654276 n=1 Tax=Cydia amplana TaxID=1869771 RepID=UPI002FE69D02